MYYHVFWQLTGVYVMYNMKVDTNNNELESSRNISLVTFGDCAVSPTGVAACGISGAAMFRA